MKKKYIQPIVETLLVDEQKDILMAVSDSQDGIGDGGNAGENGKPDPDVKMEQTNIWDNEW